MASYFTEGRLNSELDGSLAQLPKLPNYRTTELPNRFALLYSTFAWMALCLNDDLSDGSAVSRNNLETSKSRNLETLKP